MPWPGSTPEGSRGGGRRDGTRVRRGPAASPGPPTACNHSPRYVPVLAARETNVPRPMRPHTEVKPPNMVRLGAQTPHCKGLHANPITNDAVSISNHWIRAWLCGAIPAGLKPTWTASKSLLQPRPCDFGGSLPRAQRTDQPRSEMERAGMQILAIDD